MSVRVAVVDVSCRTDEGGPCGALKSILRNLVFHKQWEALGGFALISPSHTSRGSLLKCIYALKSYYHPGQVAQSVGASFHTPKSLQA